MQEEPTTPSTDSKPNRLIIVVPVLLLIAIAVGISLSRSNSNSTANSNSNSSAPADSFKSTIYTDVSGVRYVFDFYEKYSTTKLKSGNSQLVAEATRGDKFPLVISINSGEEAGYAQIKNCTSYTKAFDVQNASLHQEIAVCDMAAGRQSNGQDTSDTIYVAGFLEGGQAHIVTISQDYSEVDTSSQRSAQKSVKKFGMKPYAADIKRIIASIRVEQEI